MYIVYIYIYTISAHTQIHTCTPICIYTYTNASIYINIYTHIHMDIHKLNLEGIQYDITDTSSFTLHAIFSQYFLPTK